MFHLATECLINYEVDQDGDISIRDELLKVTPDTLQQDQSRILRDVTSARIQKLMIPHEEEQTDEISSWRYK